MSQKTEIVVRHTASNTVRETISRVIRTREINGEPVEVVMYEGNYFRVIRKGRGVYFFKNRPIASLGLATA